jgi:hypothetical protein
MVRLDPLALLQGEVKTQQRLRTMSSASLTLSSIR